MEQNQNDLLRETYQLAKENNKILHKMRRNAFWGGILKFIFYILVLVVAPLWLYATYLAPIMQEAVATINEIQGTGAKAQGQIGDFQKILSDLQAQLPAGLLPK